MVSIIAHSIVTQNTEGKLRHSVLELRYAERHISTHIRMSLCWETFMQNTPMLSVIMPSVVMVIVEAQKIGFK